MKRNLSLDYIDYIAVIYFFCDENHFLGGFGAKNRFLLKLLKDNRNLHIKFRLIADLILLVIGFSFGDSYLSATKLTHFKWYYKGRLDAVL